MKTFRWLIAGLLAAVVFPACGPLDGGDPLDGPPGTEGPSLHLKSEQNSPGTTGSMGVDANYDRY